MQDILNKVTKCLEDHIEKVTLQFGNLKDGSTKFEKFLMLDQRLSFKEWTHLQSMIQNSTFISFLGRRDYKIYKYGDMQLNVKKFGNNSKKLYRISSNCMGESTLSNGKFVRIIEKKPVELPIHRFENRREYPYEVDEITYIYGSSSDKIKIKFYQIERNGKKVYYYEIEISSGHDSDELNKILKIFT